MKIINLGQAVLDKLLINCVCITICVYLLISAEFVEYQANGGILTSESRKLETSSCICMDYWECAQRNGQVYSYCGISDNEVCCFVNDHSEKQSKVLNEEIEIKTTEKAAPEVAVTEDESGTEVDLNSFNSLDKLSSFEICGQPSVPVKLDFNAHFGEWPWHVAILEVSEDLYICGGALVSKNRVITAAHCLSTYTGITPRLKIRAGEYDVSGNNEPQPHVEVLVGSINIHPDFDNASLANDIAIIELSRSINFTMNIQPLCLPQSGGSKLSGSQCVVTGWGRISEESNHSIVLKEVVAPLWSNEQCQRRLQKKFGSNYQLPATAICAGDQGTQGSICDGDGGGPLVCLEDGKWQHEGIVSFGISCAVPNSPGVYTRTSSYLNWIRDFMQ